MYEELGNQLGAAIYYFAGTDGYMVTSTEGGKLTLEWYKDEPEPTLEQLQEALWKGSWEQTRTRRNELLAVTDFYALTDVPMSADMTTYRQALRDVPASVEDSKDVVWPEKP